MEHRKLGLNWEILQFQKKILANFSFKYRNMFRESWNNGKKFWESKWY